MRFMHRTEFAYQTEIGSEMCLDQTSTTRSHFPFIKLPFVIKTFALSIFEWPFNTGFSVCLIPIFCGPTSLVLPCALTLDMLEFMAVINLIDY